MAKLKMKNIRIAVTKKDLKRAVSFIQKAGAIEIKTTKKIEGFNVEDTLNQKLTFERMVSSCENALEIVLKFAPVKSGMLSFLNGRREVTLDEYHQNIEKATDTIQACYDIIALEKQLGDCKGEISRISIALDEMQPWMKLDVPTGFTGTKFTAAFIGSFGYEATAGEIIEKLKENGFDGDCEVEIISSIPLQTCVFISCLTKDSENLYSCLRKIGFATVSNPDKKMLSVEKAKLLENRRADLTDAIDRISKLIASYQNKLEDIKFFSDFYSMRAERYELYGQLLQSKNVAIIDGFIPEKFADKLKDELEERFVAAVEITEPAEDEDVPVALQNGKFSEPCQSIVSMYSLPGRHDIDPTAPMAIFFYIFFGFMLSDAGYGLLITLACCIGLAKFNLEDNWKNNLRLFRNCGIATMIWGAVFGSFFGDMIPKICLTYFGYNFTMPHIQFFDNQLYMLVFGIALGIVHIYFGMIINFINLCRQKRVLDALFDVGFWLVTLTGSLLLVVGAVVTMPILNTIGMWAMILGAIGLVLTQGREKKGFGKVISGVASLYDITSYASDILSYSRLMALGIATGVFAQVINQLGASPGIGGVIKYVLIFIIGNAISLAMNALGAYVHTIRLQYVEFFSKFYEGGGRAFNPFYAKTKFIRFKKEQKN